MEHAIRTGGKFALAWPRGRGKTALFIFAALWAILNGYRRYVFVMAANEHKAEKIVRALKKLLTKSQSLRSDFPEATQILWRLEGINQRKLLWNGKVITYSMEAGRIVLPVIPGSVCAGAIIECAGLESATRGTFDMSDDLEHLRPDALLIDDPQTKESATSPTQVETRWSLIKEAALGMSGIGKALAAIAAVTVIAEGDVAQKLLDHKLSPEWRGELFPLMPKVPQSELWEEYARLRAESLVGRGDISLATDFYIEHRTEMDTDAEVMWAADFKSDAGEVSAVQAAMNLFFEDAAVFWAEYQQQPGKLLESGDETLTATAICHRLTGLPRYIVPANATFLTAFIDVQEKLLYYAVVAWSAGFTGSVIDYGTFPEQRRLYFTLRDAQRTLDQLKVEGVLLGGLSLEERWLKALRAFTEELLSKQWQRECGGTCRIDKTLVDAQYGKSTKVVYRFVQASPHRAILLPSHGEPLGPTSKRISERKVRDDQRRGEEWIEDLHPEHKQKRVHYDANHWKTFLRNRLTVDPAARGALRFFGDETARHQMIADHVLSERPIAITSRGADMVLFSKPTGDNHGLDCLTGNCVCASSLGMSLDGMAIQSKPRGRRRTLAEVMGAG